MERLLPRQLQATFTADWAGPFDGRDLDPDHLARTGHLLFPWRTESTNPWWGRPLKLGEVGCTLAHLACWRRAAARRESLVMILEDDVVLCPDFLQKLTEGLERLRAGRSHAFDLLYLGRQPLSPDGPEPDPPGFVTPGYSHCTFGYLLTRRAVRILLGARLQRSIVPVDEFLPSMYVSHPRPDLRARFAPRLTALAFDPPLVRQLPKREAGSDTEDSPFVEPSWYQAPSVARRARQ